MTHLQEGAKPFHRNAQILLFVCRDGDRVWSVCRSFDTAHLNKPWLSLNIFALRSSSADPPRPSLCVLFYLTQQCSRRHFVCLPFCTESKQLFNIDGADFGQSVVPLSSETLFLYITSFVSSNPHLSGTWCSTRMHANINTHGLRSASIAAAFPVCFLAGRGISRLLFLPRVVNHLSGHAHPHFHCVFCQRAMGGHATSFHLSISACTHLWIPHQWVIQKINHSLCSYRQTLPLQHWSVMHIERNFYSLTLKLTQRPQELSLNEGYY